MRIAVLALQGAFAEHCQKLSRLGAQTMELRKKEDLQHPFDALILPGGESTVMGKLLRELDMFEILQKKILHGLPTWGTCAGMILLAKILDIDSSVHLGTMDITVTDIFWKWQQPMHDSLLFSGVTTIMASSPQNTDQLPIIRPVS